MLCSFPIARRSQTLSLMASSRPPACEKPSECTFIRLLLRVLLTLLRTRETLPTYLPINLGLDSTDHLMRACVVHYAAHRSPTLGSPEDTRFRARVLHRVHVELAALPSAPASRDTLRACLVFSHAPGGTTVHALPSRADPFGASARAFASLEEVGVNEAVYILGRGAWTTVGVDNLIEDVQLVSFGCWALLTGVVLRSVPSICLVNWLVYHSKASLADAARDHMFTALSFFPPASSAPRLYSILPVERARSLGPETVHLVLESMLLDATQPLTEAVRALRIAPTFDSALVDNLLATIQATHDRLEAWREVVTTESLGECSTCKPPDTSKPPPRTSSSTRTSWRLPCASS